MNNKNEDMERNVFLDPQIKSDYSNYRDRRHIENPTLKFPALDVENFQNINGIKEEKVRIKWLTFT